MKTIKEMVSECNKTGFPCGYSGNKEDWYIVYSVHRDSGILDRANFKTIENMLEEIDPHKETWDIERFSHWAVGWIDYIVVKPNSEAYRFGLEIQKRLEEYPILDEELYSYMKYGEACEVWDNLDHDDKEYYCERAGIDKEYTKEDKPPYEVIEFLVNY